MISYKALTTASTLIEVVDDLSLYESELFSSNGNILYPYDTETTITATIFKNLKDVTKEIKDIRWSIFSSDNKQLEEDKIWNEANKGKNPITINKDEINGKATIQFEAYKNFSGIPGDDTLIAFNRITIIDTNDLLATGLKPSNPYVGQVWIDSSKEPATMWMWNGIKWVSVGTVMAMVKNLIRNSAFSTYNYEYFNIVGNTVLSYIPVVKINNGKKWLNLVSDVETEEHRGIMQITDDTETIYINSEYSFQFLVYNNSSDSNQIQINIYSLNKNKEKTLIYKDLYEINNNIKHYFTTFKTLEDTTNIEVEILGLDGSKYNFYITELALYNTSNIYPWEPSPYDSEMIYDPEALFNALTYNGQIQGIYSMVNPNTGQIQYYFNAEYIQSGHLKGEYIDAKNLVVERDDGVRTLEIDKYGNVNLIVNSLKIGAEKQTIEEFVFDKLDELNPDQLKFLLMQIKKDHEQTQAQYEQYYFQFNADENLKDIDYREDYWSNYLDDDMIQRAKEEDSTLVNIRQIKFNANDTATINNEEVSKAFILGKALLGISRLGNIDVDGAKLIKLLYYTNLAYVDSYDALVKTIEAEINKKNGSFYTSSEEVDLDDAYADYSTKNSLLYKLFVVCEDYITNKKITIVTDEWSKINVDATSIVEEVGQIKYMYCGEGEDKTLVNAFGSIANEKITANSIVNKVSEGVAENNELSKVWTESIIKQTSGNINLSVNDYRKGLNASLELSNDGVILKKDGSIIDMNGDSITLTSNNINLEGYVTFSKLASEPKEDDTTIIHGGYLETGTVNGNTIIAKTMSADAISTGILTNEREGYTGPVSLFNLDNGTFKLGDSLVYENGQLSFSGIIGGDYSFSAGLPSWVQKWTTNATEISGEQIVTPRAFIGTYDETGEVNLTGISIGVDLDSRHTAGEEGMLDSGIVGYSGGNVTFRLNTDGSAIFGGEDRKLIINTDGSLSVPIIYGNEISAYNLQVFKKDPITKQPTTNTSLSIDEIGNINITPNEFYLSDGITLNNEGLIVNANYITTGKMSAGCVNITDGSFVVGDIFRIDDENNVYINPTEFHLTNSSTNEDAICLKKGITTINADYITSGEINGELIKANSIESCSLMIGDAINRKNNLTKTALFYKCNSLIEIDNPSLIENCTLENVEHNIEYNYICTGNKDTYILVDLKQFYNITTSKIYFKPKDNNKYLYFIEYSIDKVNWHSFMDEDIDWYESNINEEYTLVINNDGVTARYFKLYLNGSTEYDINDEPINTYNTSIVLGWELYGAGNTTTIDASGILTGEINASRIATKSITTEHINIKDDSFQFINDNDETVFGITGVLDDNNNITEYKVIVNPNTFILKGKLGNGIVLDNNELSINASYIDVGNLKADLIKTGELDATNITVKNFTGDKIDGRKLVIKRKIGNDEINTFEITEDGQVIVNEADFVIRNGNDTNTVQGMVDNLDRKIGSYIKMNNGEITIGKTDDDIAYKTVLSSDKLKFMYQNTEVAYISNQKMYIGNAEINEKLTIGREVSTAPSNSGYYDFTYRSNGHLTLKWRDK